MSEFRFEAEVIHWRGPAPFYFARLPEEVARQVGEMAKAVSYGWGVIPVEAVIGEVTFRTSLFPKEGAICCRSRMRCARKSPFPKVACWRSSWSWGRPDGKGPRWSGALNLFVA